ncbi:MAG: DoxX family protein [Candidatus Aceula meridiana]|nr:DoxX family protein [Candidatus Aceula meridiana]
MTHETNGKCCFYTGWSIGILRLFVAWIFIKAGLGKVYGMFDGPGLAAFGGYLSTLGIIFPKMMAYVVGWSEIICGGLLAIGFLSRIAAVPVIIIMIVAVAKVHPDDFYYPAMIALSAFVFLQYGSGKLSLDGIICHLRKQK